MLRDGTIAGVELARTIRPSRTVQTAALRCSTSAAPRLAPAVVASDDDDPLAHVDQFLYLSAVARPRRKPVTPASAPPRPG
jgi:hypothetical protein